jgi:hypothetical protein
MTLGSISAPGAAAATLQSASIEEPFADDRPIGAFAFYSLAIRPLGRESGHIRSSLEGDVRK